MTDHGFQQALHAAHVIVEILEGIDHALAHLRIGGEVHDAVDAETAEDAVQTGGIADVALHEGSLARHGGGMARLEIVHHHDFLPGRCQGMDRVGTDIARTAANKDRHTDLHDKDDGGTLRCLPAAGKAGDTRGHEKDGAGHEKSAESMARLRARHRTRPGEGRGPFAATMLPEQRPQIPARRQEHR